MRSFYHFFRQAWHVINPDKTYVDGKHIEVICNHLELVATRRIKRLLINIPPRLGKSSLISVAFPAWVWLHKPSEQFLCASYVSQFSYRDSRMCRHLIQSPWYQRNWKSKFSLLKDQNTKGRFDNTRGGYRIATSSKGSTTAEGGGIIIVDDPNNAKDASSEVDREGRIDWWTQVLSTRVNDPKNDAIVVVQQRVHERDVSGFIIANDEDDQWTKLILPMEYEASRKCVTYVDGEKYWEDWRTEDGELLWPSRIGENEINGLKHSLGSYGYAGQYQQRPSPTSGGILKREWFRKYQKKQFPEFKLIIQSWDTAFSDKPTASYSACTTWGLFKDTDDIMRVVLISAWRGRVNYPELRKRAKRLYDNINDTGDTVPNSYISPHRVIVEKKATGDPLIRDLQLAGVTNAIGYLPKGDKETRVQRISALIEGGYVYVQSVIADPERLPRWTDEFVEACVLFPNAESNDYVDSMTQVLQYLVDNNGLRPDTAKI